MIGILLGLLATWLFISSVFYESGFKSSYGYSGLDEERTKTNWNAIALFLNIRDGDFEIPKIPKRKTGIDKEIAEEEKEIAELERQKEKIDTLAELKRRKGRLFEEVHERGEWTDEDEIYHCYRCDSFITGLDNFYKHHKEWHK